MDAAVLSAHAKSKWEDEPPVHVTFVDWIPGICSLLGYLVINMIDKDRVRGEEGFGDSRAVWRARLVLFIGFALMAGGLAGSVVCRSPFLFLTLTTDIGIDGFDFEVYFDGLSSSVHLLRVCKRVAECGPYAFRSGSLDCAEYKQ